MIGAAISQRLVVIARASAGSRPLAPSDGASPCLKADNSSAPARVLGDSARPVNLRWLSLKDSHDLLLAYMFVGSHDSFCDRALVSALADAVIDACARCSAYVQRVAEAHELVEILWSLSVARSSDRTQRTPAGDERGDWEQRLDSLIARLLHILACRWSSGLMTFACRDSEEAGEHGGAWGAGFQKAQASRCARNSHVGSEIKDLHAQMLLQVVVMAPHASLQQQSVDSLVKHVREIARQSDCARLARHDAMLDDMHQVPPHFIHDGVG